MVYCISCYSTTVLSNHVLLVHQLNAQLLEQSADTMHWS